MPKAFFYSTGFCVCISYFHLSLWLYAIQAIFYFGCEYSQAQNRYIGNRYVDKMYLFPWEWIFKKTSWTIEGLFTLITPSLIGFFFFCVDSISNNF